MNPSERIHEIMVEEIKTYKEKYGETDVDYTRFLPAAIVHYLDEQALIQGAVEDAGIPNSELSEGAKQSLENSKTLGTRLEAILSNNKES